MCRVSLHDHNAVRLLQVIIQFDNYYDLEYTFVPRMKSMLRDSDLIKIVSLGFQNPQFYEISNLITSFDDSKDRVLDFDEFF